MRTSLLILPLTLIGCLDPTQITVELYKDGDDVCNPMPQTAVTIATAEAIDTSSPAAVADTCTADTSHAGATARIGSIVAVPHDDPSVDVAIEAMMSLAGNDPASTCLPQPNGKLPPECILARRQLRFIEHTPLELPIVMQVACGGVLCDDDKTCVNGDCVDAQVECDNGVCDEPDPPASDGWPVVLEGIGGVDLGGLVRDGEGNVYVAGTCGGALKVLSPGDTDPPVVGDPEAGGTVTIFVVKLSAEGEYLAGTTLGSSAVFDASTRAVRDLAIFDGSLFVGAEAYEGFGGANGSFVNAGGGLLLRLSRQDLSLIDSQPLNPTPPVSVDVQALAVTSNSVLGGFNYNAGPNLEPVLGNTPPAPVGAALGALEPMGGGVAFLYAVTGDRNAMPPRVSAAAAMPDGSMSFLAGTTGGPLQIGAGSALPLVPSAGAFLVALGPQRAVLDAFGFATNAPIRIAGLGSEVTANRVCAAGTVEADAMGNTGVTVAVTSHSAANTTSWPIIGTNAKFSFVTCPLLENTSGGSEPHVVLEGASREDETELLGATSQAGTLFVGGWASSRVELPDGSTVTNGGQRPFVATIDTANTTAPWSVDLEPPAAKLERLELAAIHDEEVLVAGQLEAEYPLGPSETVPEGRKVFIRPVKREAP